ncbi:hypothetical protein [Micrococcus sp.]|uniref:hypothetical protein n=1 Tax=Micrococcus sp. TaxID=1271 RepID=UPI002A90A0FA|nr:hypothetical protein [Micrococcus sp.]MDY6055018.1 hypothetical protein [Micrococcus sp.]
MTSRIAAGIALAAVAALALTACGSADPSAVEALEGSPANAAPPHASEGTWDPAAWVPTEKVERRMTDEAERERWYEANKAREAAGLGLVDPPPVTRRGWASSTQEHERWVAQCMRERGVPATYDEVRGGIAWDAPPESQEEAYKLASWSCSFTFPVDPSLSQDWSEAQLRLAYDYWDQYAIPCLEGHGLTVDRSTQPSKEAWVAAFHTSGRISWWPVQDSLVGLDDARYAEITATCPELPPQDVFWGTAP